MTTSVHTFDSLKLPAVRYRSEEVAGLIGDRIRSGAIGAGARLPTELAMAAQLGVSRTVVREAIARMKSEGLVESRQGAGAFVSHPGRRPIALSIDPQTARSITSVLQILELRRTVEAEIAEIAAQRRTGQDLAAIKRACAAIARDVRSGGDGVAADVAFHRAIAAATHNPYFNLLLDYLQLFLYHAVGVTRANEARRIDFMRQFESEHRAIIAAIERSDAAAARRAARLHMDNARVRIGEADAAFWSEEGGIHARALMVNARAPADNPSSGRRAGNKQERRHHG